MRSLAVLAFSLLAATAAADDNWPRFRGPTGDGQSKAVGLPVKWSEKENVVWKSPVAGAGWSSPVVWGNQVWVTAGSADGKQLSAICFDRDTGKVVHDVKFEAKKPQIHNFNSPASPTPVIEDGRIYVHFGAPLTVCIDTKSGKVLWERQDIECNHFRGAGSSPIVSGDLLFLTFDGFDHQFVMALNKADGATAWRKDRSIKYHSDNGDLRKSYGTPTILDVAGKPQLISSAADATIAYDPKTGAEIWTVYHGGMNSATPPLPAHGRVILTTAAPSMILAVQPEGTGDVTKTHVAWSSTKIAVNKPSPILVGDHLYVVTDGNGTVHCLNAKTGEPLKQQRLGGKFSASPIAADGKLYYCNEDGMAFVVEANPEMKVVAENQHAAGFRASPAVAGKSLFLRTLTHLYRIETK